MGSRVINYGRFPGLQRALTSADLTQAGDDHNNLPEERTLLNVGEKALNKHISFLRQLFEYFGVQNLFGVLVPHMHDKVPDGFHLAGQVINHRGRCYYWTEKVQNKKLNPNELCGRNFLFDSQRGFCPYEFHQGPLPDLSKVDPDFFQQFINYLYKHSLTSILGLKYIVPDLPATDMLEFIFPECRLLLVPVSLLPSNTSKTVTTCWGWSPPISKWEIKCIVFPDGEHKKVDIKPKKSNARADDVICAFEKEYLNLS